MLQQFDRLTLQNHSELSVKLDISVIVIHGESNLLNLVRFTGEQELSDLIENVKLFFFNVQANGIS